MTTLKLGKGMKVFPLPSMQISLHEHFVPQVKKLIGKRFEACKIELKFVEHMAQVDGMRYNLTVEAPERCTATALLSLAQLLDQYCSNGGDIAESFTASDGRTYMIGDGDDTGAVVFEHGCFNIWLRGWPHED